MNSDLRSELAIFGGPKVRPTPMPPRRLFGPSERRAVEGVFDYYEKLGADFSYQGHFEREYTDAFVRSLGGEGFADGVATGTAALFVAVAALGLPERSEVLISALAGDPGNFNAVVLNRLVPRVIDTAPGSYVVGADEVAARITPATKAILVVHTAGVAAPMDEIVEIARAQGIPVIEDCSQAHGATYRGRKVGTFGEIAAFSTMSRKNHATGGCGGVVYTRDLERYRMARAHADRGKAFWLPDFSDKEQSGYLFPALNLNIDEISCAIGTSTLARVESTRETRFAFVERLSARLEGETRSCRAYPLTGESASFFLPIFVATELLTCTKREFAEAVAAEGITINPHYRTIISEWPWAQPYLGDTFSPVNAITVRDTSFNLLFHEQYGEQEQDDILAAIGKVERVYLR